MLWSRVIMVSFAEHSDRLEEADYPEEDAQIEVRNGYSVCNIATSVCETLGRVRSNSHFDKFELIFGQPGLEASLHCSEIGSRLYSRALDENGDDAPLLSRSRSISESCVPRSMREARLLTSACLGWHRGDAS